MSTDFGSTGLTLAVVQPLYRRQNIVVYEQAMTQVEQADAQLAAAAQDLILRVSQAYFEVLNAQDTVAFAEAQKTAIGQQLEQAKRNFEVGTATITDTHEAQARYDLTLSQEITARNDLELRRRALEQIIARAAPPIAPLGRQFTLKLPQPATMDSWVDARASDEPPGAHSAKQPHVRDTGSRPQPRSALPHARCGRKRFERRKQREFCDLDRRRHPQRDGGARLELPIYQGGAVNSRVREAIANEDRVRHELEAARRSAEFNARQAFLGITSGMASVRALEAALVSTQSQLASTRLGQEVGVRTQVDVLNAQQQLFSAQRDLAQAKYNYILSLLRLEAAIGELTENDLVAVNEWLDRAAAGSKP